jgi:predicted phage tail protein
MAALTIDYTPRTEITLCGSLGKKFGKVHNYLLGTGDVREAMRAIDVNHPGFFRELANAKAKGLEFAVYRNGRNVGEKELHLGNCRKIKIVPVICGSKRAGVLQTVIGAVLIVGGLVLQQPWMVQMGAAALVGGVVQMISPQSQGLKTSAAPENTPGYAFGSAKNTTASGLPVPLCLGYRRWGGAIISCGIYAEDQM